MPPFERNKEDFDPGSKYHIAASVPYDRYFDLLLLILLKQLALIKLEDLGTFFRLY